MPQEHSRAIGGWQAEWETLTEQMRLAAGAAHGLAELLTGLEVDTARMRDNLALTRGLAMAERLSLHLAAQLGRSEAHDRVAAAGRVAVESGRPLAEVVAEDPRLGPLFPPGELDRLLDPATYLGSATAFVERAIAAHREDP